MQETIDQEKLDKITAKFTEGLAEMSEKIAEAGRKMEATLNNVTASLKPFPTPDENPMNVPRATIAKRRQRNKAARKARRINR